MLNKTTIRLIIKGIFIALVIYFVLMAWDYANSPQIVGTFYNPTFGFYEPIYTPAVEGIDKYVTMLIAIPMMWWHAPVWLFILFNIVFAMTLFFIIEDYI